MFGMYQETVVSDAPSTSTLEAIADILVSMIVSSNFQADLVNQWLDKGCPVESEFASFCHPTNVDRDE